MAPELAALARASRCRGALACHELHRVFDGDGAPKLSLRGTIACLGCSRDRLLPSLFELALDARQQGLVDLVEQRQKRVDAAARKS